VPAVDRLLPARHERLGHWQLEIVLASGLERKADVLVGEPQGEAGSNSLASIARAFATALLDQGRSLAEHHASDHGGDE
jgi:hypothetical protein